MQLSAQIFYFFFVRFNCVHVLCSHIILDGVSKIYERVADLVTPAHGARVRGHKPGQNALGVKSVAAREAFCPC